MEKKVVTTNRKAFHDFLIFDKFIAGIVLTGTEIKSIRKGSVNLRDTYARIKNNEVYVVNMFISAYDKGNQFNHDERRQRKLLLHKKEIIKLSQEIKEQGLTLVPLKLYFKDNHAKLLIGLCKGKKLYDKRETIKKRDIERDSRY
jgi:SsrA-binding protein